MSITGERMSGSRSAEDTTFMSPKVRLTLSVLVRILLCVAAACGTSGREGGDAGNIDESEAGSSDVVASVCEAGAGPRTLYDFGGMQATQPAIVGDEVIVAATSSIMAVPSSGGPPRIVTDAISPTSAVVLGGSVFYQGLENVPGSDPDAGVPVPSETQLFSVGLAGGTPEAFPALKHFTPRVTDGTALYLSYDPTGFDRWVPPSGAPTALPLDTNLLIDGVLIQGNFLYVAAQDIKSAGFSNGLIGRMPKSGGAFERIVSGIGHPSNLAADATSFYWAEDPQAITGNGKLVRSALDGSGITMLYSGTVFSVAVRAGRVFFSWGTEIDSVASVGGSAKPLATGLKNAGFLTLGDNTLSWVDPVQLSFSSTASPVLVSLCLSPP